MSSKLTDFHREEILKQLGTGKSTRTVAEWVTRTFGVKVSHVAISKIAKTVQTQRSDVAKAVVREAVAGALTGDLDILGTQIERLEALASASYKHAKKYPAETQPFLNVDRSLREAIDQRLKRSGADEPSEPILGLCDWLGQVLSKK
jgi:hypothetical protein